jgi:hypothetical protein
MVRSTACVLLGLSLVRADAPPQAHAITAADLKAFLDGVMPLQLRREDIAGAVIAVVKDGKVLFANG